MRARSHGHDLPPAQRSCVRRRRKPRLVRLALQQMVWPTLPETMVTGKHRGDRRNEAQCPSPSPARATAAPAGPSDPAFSAFLRRRDYDGQTTRLPPRLWHVTRLFARRDQSAGPPRAVAQRCCRALASVAPRLLLRAIRPHPARLITGCTGRPAGACCCSSCRTASTQHRPTPDRAARAKSDRCDSARIPSTVGVSTRAR